MMTTGQHFAGNLRRFRVAHGLTQEQLAERAGFNSQTVSNYENGTRWPQPDVIDVLAKALKVRPWQLLAGEGEGGEIPPELVDHIAAAARVCGLKVNGRS